MGQLQQLGIDAVAVVPYTFMSAPTEIVPLEVPRRAGSETDEDITYVIRRASERGLTVLLKSQIWVAAKLARRDRRDHSRGRRPYVS